MGNAPLAEHLDTERGVAVRILLRSPILDADTDPDGFRLVGRHASWLVDYFEQTCGWTLTVDPAAGFARLAKRPAAQPDLSRPLRQVRGPRTPFDRRRYTLLCLACAELIRHPVTTVGLLADAVRADSGLDTTRRAERKAFVDALQVLVEWGALRTSAGEIDAFAETETANALLTAETARLHRLLVSSVAPSALPPTDDLEKRIEGLLLEPRYETADSDAEVSSHDTRLRAVRHRLGRRLVDDPIVYTEDLPADERDYLANPSGRRWIRDRAAMAGFIIEERSEGILAVDPDEIATDSHFPAPIGNVHQFADHFVTNEVGARGLRSSSLDEVVREVRETLSRFPQWARRYREPGGAELLAADAIKLLVSFGLVRWEPGGRVLALPAIARYRVGDPVVTGATSSPGDNR
jgi:uncharacterized protein (TIGR02678 family)